MSLYVPLTGVVTGSIQVPAEPTSKGDTSPMAIVKAMESMSSYPASFGSPGYELSFSPTKHTAFSGECGMVMVQFDENNTPHPWPVYQPSC